MTIKGYKGFDKDLKCQGFQFEEGKEYEEKAAKACSTGFHFCENPIDIFKYYPPAKSLYHLVEGFGTIDRHNDDTKIACTNIKIGVRITVGEIITASVNFLINKVKGSDKFADGDYSSAASNGNSSSAASNGNSSSAASNGDYSSAASNGYSSSAASNGDYSSAASNGNSSSAASNERRQRGQATLIANTIGLKSSLSSKT